MTEQNLPTEPAISSNGVLADVIQFVRERYSTAKCVAGKSPFNTHQIIEENGRQISWISGKANGEEEAWRSAKDAIIGRAKSVREMNNIG